MTRERSQRISEVTRRAIFNELTCVAWSGNHEEPEFLERVCQPDNARHTGAIAGAWQHRVRNWDWDDDWVFKDAGLNLVGCSDEFFLRFLCETVHPAVRPDSGDARSLAITYNKHLLIDGWALVEGEPISGRPMFVAKRCASPAVVLPDVIHTTDVLTDEYVRELAAKCDSRLASGDLDGAITAARTMLEAVLVELEKRLAGAPGDYKGDLPRQFKAVTKQLRIDDERDDLNDNFKQVARGLVQVVNGLAPIRNKMSDGHARQRKPEVHHARVIVNATKTVATFLVESFLAQRERGLLAGPSSLNNVERTSGGSV